MVGKAARVKGTSMTSGEVRVERARLADAHGVSEIAEITLHNPGKRNAITVAMWRQLADAMTTLTQEPLRAVVIRGADGHFAGGADIAEFLTERTSVDSALAYHRDVVAVALGALENCPHPMIAAIEGVCVGGGLEIALTCDLRIAHTDAVFGAPVGKLGFALALAEMRLLLDTVSRSVAAELLIEGRLLDAKCAFERGLITRTTHDLPAELDATLSRIVQGSPEAAREHKAFLRRLQPDRTGAGTRLSEAEWLDSMAFAERADYRARVEAFVKGKR
jgi:enoyl-CoA hydratase/carnithine racemase